MSFRHSRILLLFPLAALVAGATTPAPREIALGGPEVLKLDWNTRSLHPVDLNKDGRTDLAVVNNDPHPIVVPGCLSSDCNGFGIVGITADKQAPTPLGPDLQRMSHRDSDDGTFLPCGDEDRAVPGQRRSDEPVRVDPLRFRAARHPHPEIGQIDNQLVERSDQEKCRGKKEQLVPRQLEQVSPCQLGQNPAP